MYGDHDCMLGFRSFHAHRPRRAIGAGGHQQGGSHGQEPFFPMWVAIRYTKWSRLDSSSGFGLCGLGCNDAAMVVSFRHVEGALVTLAHQADEVRALCTCTSCLCAPLILQTDMTAHRGAAPHIPLTCTSLATPQCRQSSWSSSATSRARPSLQNPSYS